MSWVVGSTTDPNWQAGSTSGFGNALIGSVADFLESVAGQATAAAPIPTITQVVTPYQAGETCELSVFGADGVFQILWSPINDPLDAAAVALTVTSSNLVAGAGSVFVTAQRTVVRYGDQGWLFLEQGGVYSVGLQATLVAESGKQYVVLADPLVAPELGVWAVPDLVAGDMLIWWNALPSGAVEVFPDRSFETDETVLTFDVEAHVNTGLYVEEGYWNAGYAYGSGYTNTETQNIDFSSDPSLTGAVTDFFEIVAGAATYVPTGNVVTASLTDFPNTAAGTADTSGFSEWVSPVPFATCTGQALVNQTGISYAILPGHVLHAPEAIAVREDGTTDAQGIFRAQNIFYTAGLPVTLLARWIEGGRDRFVILYTQLTVQG